MTNAYKKAGLNDNAIKNLIAKNALETNYGKSPVGKYNYGNITTGSSWKGDFVEGKDKDAEGNEITARFRSYKNVDDFVKDEI
jgi:flagellum-specific peptidoglycan hydrolase FlgJ